MSKTQKLSLLSNSISYFREAVSYAQQDAVETNHWKFAIVHVVQAMELAFKEYLRRIHPAFIYESIDRADKTVTFRGALGRLRNPQIGNLAISEVEKAKIEKAFDLRNELTHFEFDHPHEHMELKFAEIFSFMVFFYKDHLDLSSEEFIDEGQLWKIIQLVKAHAELIARAHAYIADNDVGPVWICPACTEDTFLPAQTQCCFCHHKEDVLECPSCGSECFESDLIDLSYDFDYETTEGRTTLVDDFGLEHNACPDCVSNAREKIENIRRERYYEDMEMEEYYARRMQY